MLNHPAQCLASRRHLQGNPAYPFRSPERGMLFPLLERLLTSGSICTTPAFCSRLRYNLFCDTAQ